MVEIDKNKIEFLDILIILLKWKKTLIGLGITVFVLSYLIVFFLVREEFKATATILPVEDTNSSAGLSSVLKGLNNLPLNLFQGGKSENVNLYNTIIYSRTCLEHLIRKFKLMQDYEIDSLEIGSMEKAVKILTAQIETEETKKQAFIISITSVSRDKAAEMTNYLIEYLNKSVISLKIKKSKNNRIYIESRYAEINERLRKAEDSLVAFQKKTGVLEIKEQIKGSIAAYTNLEADLASKEIQFSVMSEILDYDSPNLKMQKLQVSELKDKIENLKKNNGKNDLLLSLRNLPDISTEYVRLYRNVQIYNAMLEFITPLFEQTKFEENKDIPVLQVVDSAIPPSKRYYPKRTLIAGVSALFVITLFSFFVLVFELSADSKNEKILFLKNNFFRF